MVDNDLLGGFILFPNSRAKAFKRFPVAFNEVIVHMFRHPVCHLPDILFTLSWFFSFYSLLIRWLCFGMKHNLFFAVLIGLPSSSNTSAFIWIWVWRIALNDQRWLLMQIIMIIFVGILLFLFHFVQLLIFRVFLSQHFVSLLTYRLNCIQFVWRILICWMHRSTSMSTIVSVNALFLLNHLVWTCGPYLTTVCGLVCFFTLFLLDKQRMAQVVRLSHLLVLLLLISLLSWVDHLLLTRF